MLHHEVAGSGVRATVVCLADTQTDQLRTDFAWGATGGVTSYDKAMSREHVANAIVAAAGGRKPLVVVDRLSMRPLLALLTIPRGWWRSGVHSAFKKLLRSRGS